MTKRLDKHQPTRQRVAAFASVVVVAVTVLIGGCANDDTAQNGPSTQGTVVDENAPALATSGAGDAGDGVGSGAAANDGVATTAPATDPSLDAIDDESRGDRSVIERVLADASDPVTGVPLADGLPASWTTNSRGVEVRLDEAALLACANNQFAWVDLRSQNVEGAAAWLGVAAVRADQSHVAAVNAAAVPLATASLEIGAVGTTAETRAIVEEFLASCVERGFEV